MALMKVVATFSLKADKSFLGANEGDSTLSIAFFDRSASNDCFPVMIVPLGLVIKKDFSVCKEPNKNTVPRGKFTLVSSVSMNMKYSTKPSKIVFYLNEDDANLLNLELKRSTALWPHQRGLVVMEKP